MIRWLYACMLGYLDTQMVGQIKDETVEYDKDVLTQRWGAANTFSTTQLNCKTFKTKWVSICHVNSEIQLLTINIGSQRFSSCLRYK